MKTFYVKYYIKKSLKLPQFVAVVAFLFACFLLLFVFYVFLVFATMKCFSLKICFEGLQLPLKKTPVHVSSCEFWKIFKNISFVERIWVTASLNRIKYGFVYLLVILAMLVYWFTFIKKN